MITHDPRWSLPRGNTLVPSRWQATRGRCSSTSQRPGPRRPGSSPAPGVRMPPALWASSVWMPGPAVQPGSHARAARRGPAADRRAAHPSAGWAAPAPATSPPSPGRPPPAPGPHRHPCHRPAARPQPAGHRRVRRGNARAQLRSGPLPSRSPPVRNQSTNNTARRFQPAAQSRPDPVTPARRRDRHRRSCPAAATAAPAASSWPAGDARHGHTPVTLPGQTGAETASGPTGPALVAGWPRRRRRRGAWQP